MPDETLALDTSKGRIAYGDELKKLRANWEPEWEENARYLDPIRRGFGRAVQVQGERLHRGLYDTTGLDAADNFAAVIYSTMNSPANKWLDWGTPDPELNKRPRVRAWLDIAQEKTLASFRPSLSPFYAQAPEWGLSFGVFGTGILFSDVKPGRSGWIDAVLPMTECYLDINDDGEVDTLVRIFEMTARMLARKFGEDNLSEETKQALKSDPLRPIMVQHAVFPNPDQKPGRFGTEGKAWLSYYDEVSPNRQLRAAGFDRFPFAVPRWRARTNEAYGRGPGTKAATHAKALNAMEHTNLRTGQRAADPPINAPHERALRKIATGPGGVNYGGMNARGQHMVAPWPVTGNLPWSLEMADRRREEIRTAMYWSMMNVVGRTGIADEELFQRQQQQFAAMGPFTGRYQVEGLTPLATRRFEDLFRAGALPPVPPDLANKMIEPQYLSPMAQAMRAGEAAGTIRSFGFMKAHADIDPEVVDLWDSDEAVRTVHAAGGAPAKILRDPEEVEQRRALRRRQQAAAAAAEIGDKGAGALEKVARAGAAAQQAAQ